MYVLDLLVPGPFCSSPLALSNGVRFISVQRISRIFPPAPYHCLVYLVPSRGEIATSVHEQSQS